MKRLAICVGLTRVDPEHYDGWRGLCPGCDRDAGGIATLCHDEGYDGLWVLLDEAASKGGLKAAFLSAVDAGLGADDLLLLYFSGHGGQQPDVDGDEWDHRDETLCLFDGELVDDRIAEYLALLPDQVRVFFVSDSCNSGTNFRGMRRSRSTPVALRPSIEPKLRARVLHFGGCTDGRSSYGDDDGGEFTNALLTTWGRKRKKGLTYQEWWDRTYKLMLKQHGRRQVPSMAQWGLPYFADGEAMR